MQPLGGLSPGKEEVVMYYDEQVIDGVLCHRGTPDGEWIPFTVEQLTAKLQEAKAAQPGVQADAAPPKIN